MIAVILKDHQAAIPRREPQPHVLEAFIRSFLDFHDAREFYYAPDTHCMPANSKKQTGDCPSKIGILLLPLRAWRNWQTRKTLRSKSGHPCKAFAINTTC
jgi:regulator of sirC expression with transglutaminase-like and TPR domain